MNMDWQLLREQKVVLLEIADRSTDARYIEAIDGVLSLLDHLQDQAVELGSATEQVVFGDVIEETEHA